MIAVMIAADTMVKGGTIEVRDAGIKLAVVCSSPAPLSAEKISNIKAIISGERPKMPRNTLRYFIWLVCWLKRNKCWK